MGIEVLRPGLLTSVQDLGRRGWQRYGVTVGGAMDGVALRVANMLVGNEPGEAALEMTLMGPTLRFTVDAVVAVCGGDLAPSAGGQHMPNWRPLRIAGGTELRFGGAVTGCRAYIAVRGGFDVPEVLGSRSTFFQASLGGFDGRALRAGDLLPIRPTAAIVADRWDGNRNSSTPTPVCFSWGVAPSIANYSDRPTIRICTSRHWDRFTTAAQQALVCAEFEITNQSDRMGYRLAGPQLESNSTQDILSEAVSTGTIQVPPNGQPIVLMADCPVTGGYPKVAQVAGVDVPVLAQLRPGAKVRFQLISVADAHSLYCEREYNLAKLQNAIRLKGVL